MDGGQRWSKIYEKATIFTILEKISVLVMAPSSNYTKELILSLNYNANDLIKIQFSDIPIKIERFM